MIKTVDTGLTFWESLESTNQPAGRQPWAAVTAVGSHGRQSWPWTAVTAVDGHGQPWRPWTEMNSCWRPWTAVTAVDGCPRPWTGVDGLRWPWCSRIALDCGGGMPRVVDRCRNGDAVVTAEYCTRALYGAIINMQRMKFLTTTIYSGCKKFIKKFNIFYECIESIGFLAANSSILKRKARFSFTFWRAEGGFWLKSVCFPHDFEENTESLHLFRFF